MSMRRALWVLTLLGVAGDARAKSAPPKPPPRPVVHFARPIPMLPSLSRVRLEVGQANVLQIEEVALPRGDWQSGGLDFYVAFGAPGTPAAVDARLVAIPAGASESRWEDAGDPVAVEPATRQGPSAQLLLGRASMAGFVVRIKEAELRRVFGQGDAAAVRLRSLLALPAPDGQGGRDVVVRLGIHGGNPLALGRVQVLAAEPTVVLSRVEAHLCGSEADPWPLAATIVPRPPVEPAPPGPPPIEPLMAVRHATDDLCIRWWM